MTQRLRGVLEKMKLTYLSIGKVFMKGVVEEVDINQVLYRESDIEKYEKGLIDIAELSKSIDDV